MPVYEITPKHDPDMPVYVAKADDEADALAMAEEDGFLPEGAEATVTRLNMAGTLAAAQLVDDSEFLPDMLDSLIDAVERLEEAAKFAAAGDVFERDMYAKDLLDAVKAFLAGI